MQCKIEDYDHFGRGICKINGKITFVPKVRVGDMIDVQIVKEKKNYNLGISKTEKSYPSVFCPHFDKCGGCMLQQMTYQEQLQFKENKLKNILKKYAGIEQELTIVGTQNKNYRNKVIFHIKEDKIGFYEEESHQLIEIDQCYLLKEEITEVFLKLKEYIKLEKGLTKAMIRSLDKKVMLVVEGKTKKEKLKDFFPMVSVLYYNKELLTNENMLTFSCYDNLYFLSKDSFFQTNDFGLLEILKEVKRLVEEIRPENILDLYCGVGFFSLFLSPIVKGNVTGIEIVPSAIENAKKSALIGKRDNVTFLCGDVRKLFSKKDASLIIVDPPRSGLDKTIRKNLIEGDFKHMIYISCDPMTLARDLKELKEAYILKEIKLVDEFPNTYHVESICLLERLSNETEQ